MSYPEADAVDACLEEIGKVLYGSPDVPRRSPGGKVEAIAAALLDLADKIGSKELAAAVDFKDTILAEVESDLGAVSAVDDALAEIKNICANWYGAEDNATKLKKIASVLETLTAQLAAKKSIAEGVLSFGELDSRLEATPTDIAVSLCHNILSIKEFSTEKRMSLIVDVIGDLGVRLEAAEKSPPGRPRSDGTPTKRSATGSYAALATQARNKEQVATTPVDQHVQAVKELLGRIGG